MLKQMLIDNYIFGCVFFVSILGIVGIGYLIGLAIGKLVELWLVVFQLKPVMKEFYVWKRSKEGRKTRDRLLSRTQNSNKSHER